MKKILLFLLLVTQFANAQPITMKSVLRTYNDLSNHVSIGVSGNTEFVSVLSGYNTNYPFATPLTYVLRPDLSTSLHNPPVYFREKNNRGVWQADFVQGGIIKAEWFGVVADGVTDNLAAIRSAIAFLNSRGGGTLVLPPGEIGVDVIHNAPFQNARTIELCSNLKLQMAASTTLKVLGSWSSGQYYAIISTLPSGLYGNITNVTIEGNGGLLLGKRTETANDADVVHGLLLNATASSGIVIKNLRINNCHSGAQINANNVLFEDVHVTNAENNAFAVTEANDVTFYRCSGNNTRATPGGNCVQAGVDIEPDLGETVTNVRFVDCTFANNGKYGLKLQQGVGTATHFFVVNSVITGNTNVGVQIDGGSDIFVSQNKLSGNALANVANNAQILVAANRFNVSDNIVVGTPYGYGLRIASTTQSQGWVVQGNRFTDCGGLFAQSANNAAVQIAAGTAGVFANNLLHGGGEYGLLLSASDGIVFTGNTIAKFNREAVLMLTEAQNITFEGNTFAESYLSGGGQYVSLASGYEVANISFRDNRFTQALKYNNGVVSAYSAGTPSITLAQTAAAQDGWYTNYYVLVGAERIRITGYVGSTRVATLASAFASAPTPSSSTYQIVGAASPNIGIYSQDADNDQIVCINNDFLTSGCGAPYLGDAADMLITWPNGKFVSVTSTYTATLDDEILYIDASSGSITINLPSTTSGRANNKHYTFYRTDSTANNVVIDPFGGQLIDNAVTVPMGRGPESFTIVGRSDASWKTVATYETKAPIDGFPYVKLDDEWLRVIGGTNITVATNASSQVVISTSAITDAALDNTAWVRLNRAWFRLIAGTNITVATNGSGEVVITGTASSGISDATADSTPYARFNNSWRRVVAGANVTVTTNGSGEIVIASSGGGGGGPTNGTALFVDDVFVTSVNAVNSSEIDPAVSGTNLTWSIIANSIGTNKVSSSFRSFFKDRSTDTGTQTASTISDFADVQWANFTNSMVASNNISFAYDTSNKKLMISAASGGGGSATNAPIIAVDGTTTTNVNFADSSELLVTKTGTNVTYALSTSGVTAGTYSNATVTVDSKGRVTLASSGSSGGTYTNTTDQIWRTVAGVRFMVTNLADSVSIDGTKTGYSGAGTNLAISGSNDRNNPIAFTLDFVPARSNTNYLVFADFESDTGIGSATVFVDDSNGRKTNQIKFVIVATTGSVNFNQTGKQIRVWVVDPNTLISGDQITGLDASIINSGTFDVSRFPSSVLLESEAAAEYGSLDGNNLWTGTQTFTNDVLLLGNTTLSSLTVSNFVTGSWTNTGDLTVSGNLTVLGSLSATLPSWTYITNSGTGTYTVPTNARQLTVWAWAGGGSGGGGRKGATNTVSCGGGGGGSGAAGWITIPIEALEGATTITWTNGAGGVAAAAQTTNTSSGLTGSAGGNTTFGKFMVLSGGGAGGGGTGAAGTAGTGGTTYAMFNGLNGGAANGSGGAGNSGTDGDATPQMAYQMHATGGGSGGGFTALGVPSGGGRGGTSARWASNLRGASASQGAVGNPGSSAVSVNPTVLVPGGGGGGGGASVVGSGGSGGSGARPGGGGGGGGAGADGSVSAGAGGNGGDGAIIILAE